MVVANRARLIVPVLVTTLALHDLTQITGS
jgi:hypothetical protein